VRDAQSHYRGIIEQVELADRIGIDYAWLVEHHFVRHGGLFPANYAFLSYLAARTKRIRLGTGATVLPLNDPVRVAEQAATLDQLSQGRFDFGVGRGFIRDEFEAFGVDMKDSRERVEEGVALVNKPGPGRRSSSAASSDRRCRASPSCRRSTRNRTRRSGWRACSRPRASNGRRKKATTSSTSPITSTTRSRSSASLVPRRIAQARPPGRGPRGLLRLPRAFPAARR